jgi:hypothetical protein
MLILLQRVSVSSRLENVHGDAIILVRLPGEGRLGSLYGCLFFYSRLPFPRGPLLWRGASSTLMVSTFTTARLKVGRISG